MLRPFDGRTLIPYEKAILRRVLLGCSSCDSGIDTVLCADHLAMAAPFSTLAYAAAVDENIGLATFVVNQDFWNPVLLAREAASLAAISKGRFTLGVGAGHMAHENERAGLPFDENSVRAAKLGRWLAAVRAELAVLGHGDLPILVGGNGRSVLTLGGEIADVVGLVGFTHVEGGAEVDGRWFSWSGIRSRVQIVRDAAVAAGRPVPPLNSLIQGVVITGDRAGTASRMERSVPAAAMLDSPFFLLGTEDEIVAQIHRAETELGFSSFVAFSTVIDAWARIAARLR